MRILHAIHSVDPRGGGPIEGIRQLSKVYLEGGHQVEVISLDAPDAAWVKEPPLKVHAVGPGTLNYGYSPRLVRWARAHGPQYDAVIVNGIWQYHSFGIWRALHRGPTPYYVFPHGMLDPWFKRAYPLKHLKKWLYWPWAEYRVLRDAAAVLFTCEEERRLARHSFWLYRCNEQVVNYGTSRPAGDGAAQRELFLRTFPQLRHQRPILFLGRLHFKKGCDLLLRAFARVAARDSSLHLVMAGPDQTGWQAALQKLADDLGIASRTTWAGVVTGDLKWGAFRAAEVFVLPSHQENFGIAVVEALACGTPVLISNKVNVWREVAAGGAGLVGDDDLAGTAGMLKRWLDLPGRERELMRRNSAVCFDQYFDIRQAARNLMRVLEATATNR